MVIYDKLMGKRQLRCHESTLRSLFYSTGCGALVWRGMPEKQIPAILSEIKQISTTGLGRSIWTRSAVPCLEPGSWAIAEAIEDGSLPHGREDGQTMNEKTLRALVDAGAVKKVRIIADGARFHVEADTLNGSVTAFTLNGVKTWRSLDTAAKWVRSLGIGTAQIDVAKWQPAQKALRL